MIVDTSISKCSVLTDPALQDSSIGPTAVTDTVLVPVNTTHETLKKMNEEKRLKVENLVTQAFSLARETTICHEISL